MSVKVLLDRRAREVIAREGVLRRLNETGGALFGWASDDSIVVACASGPGPDAIHRPTSFEPSARTVDRLMAEVHEASGGRYGFLGTWHSHPRAPPVPSATDARTAKRMADQDGLLLPRPLMLIARTTGLAWRNELVDLRSWVWLPSEQVLAAGALKTVELDELHVHPDELALR